MEKQKRLTPEEIHEMVYNQVNRKARREDERAQKYAGKILEKLSKSNFKIRNKCRHFYPHCPAVMVRLAWTLTFNSVTFRDILVNAGFSELEIKYHDFLGISVFIAIREQTTVHKEDALAETEISSGVGTDQAENQRTRR